MTTLTAEVANEVMALDWGSWGHGATPSEIVAALRMRGVTLPTSNADARWLVALAANRLRLRPVLDVEGNELVRSGEVAWTVGT